MNRTWSVILIIVACLVILGGTYWYFEMRPEPAPAQNQSMAPAPEPVTKQEPSMPPPAKPIQTMPKVTPEPTMTVAVEPKAAPAVEEVQAMPAETPVIEEKPAVEPLLVEPILNPKGAFRLPPLSAGIGPLPVAKATPDEEQPTTVAPLLPAVPLIVGQPEFATEPEQPSTEPTTYAVMDEMAPAAVDIPSEPVFAGTPSTESTPIETIAAEVGAIAPAPEKLVLAPPVPPTPANPTTNAQVDLEPLKWAANFSVSFLDLHTPTWNRGFNINADVLKGLDGYELGGTFEFSRIDNVNSISAMATAQWKFQSGSVTFPVSVSLGPTYFYDTSASTSGFGFTAKARAGIEFALTKQMSFFYTLGLSYQFDLVNSKGNAGFEPMRIGFTYSF